MIISITNVAAVTDEHSKIFYSNAVTTRITPSSATPSATVTEYRRNTCQILCNNAKRQRAQLFSRINACRAYYPVMYGNAVYSVYIVGSIK
jgi:hypothetical protein